MLPASTNSQRDMQDMIMIRPANNDSLNSSIDSRKQNLQ